MSEKKHVELSPSKATQWWNCPGSIKLSRTVPPAPPSEYAKEGTAAHALLEKCLKGDGKGNFFNPHNFVGDEILGYEVTEEMAEAVNTAVEYVNECLQKGGQLLIETPVTVVPNKVAGTLDIAILRHFDRIIVIDYKHGAGVAVKAMENYQLLIYALGLLRKYECETVELVIIQPRCFDGDGISSWECSRDYLDDFNAELDRHIKLTEEENPIITSGSHCKWCPAKLLCPELQGGLTKALAPVKNSALLFPDAKSLSIPVIQKILDSTDLIEDWLKTVWAYAFDLLSTGGKIEGYELGKKRVNRKWKDEQAVVDQFGALGKDLFNMKLKSPAQIEKLVSKEDRKIVETLTELPEAGLKVKKVSAK